MKDLLELMKTRRSVRKYKPDMIPQDVLDRIIIAGTYSATGRNLQSPIIIAVTNKEMRDKISEMNRKIRSEEHTLNSSHRHTSRMPSSA